MSLIPLLPAEKKKKCLKCDKEFLVNKDHFHSDGRGGFRTNCKKCRVKLMVSKEKELKQRARNYKGGKCSICGYSKYYGVLEFHHIDPEKKDFELKNIKNYSWERIKEELDKCVLLCANCHREKHSFLINLDKKNGSQHISIDYQI